MKRLALLIALMALVVLLARSSTSAVSDNGNSLADSDIPCDEITTSQAQVSDSSANATITIAMYAVVHE